LGGHLTNLLGRVCHTKHQMNNSFTWAGVDSVNAAALDTSAYSITVKLSNRHT
jgi:hypothetical protein